MHPLGMPRVGGARGLLSVACMSTVCVRLRDGGGDVEPSVPGSSSHEKGASDVAGQAPYRPVRPPHKKGRAAKCTPYVCPVSRATPDRGRRRGTALHCTAHVHVLWQLDSSYTLRMAAAVGLCDCLLSRPNVSRPTCMASRLRLSLRTTTVYFVLILSGTTLAECWLGSTDFVSWACLPLLMFGFHSHDVTNEDTILREQMELCKVNQNNRDLLRRLSFVVSSGAWQATVVVLVPYVTYAEEPASASGRSNDLDLLCTTMTSGCILTAIVIKFFLMTELWGSVPTLGLACVVWLVWSTRWLDGRDGAAFYLTSVVTALLATLPDLVVRYVHVSFIQQQLSLGMHSQDAPCYMRIQSAFLLVHL